MRSDLEQLYHDNAVPLMRYLSRMGADAELASDLVQETFLRCAEQGGDVPHIREWLFRVATNLLRETGRTRRRRLLLVARAPHRVPAPEPAPTPDTEYRREQARQAVRLALMRLSPRDRMVLLMREEGFSQREIATAIGVNSNSVGKTLMRALERFTRQMSRDEQEAT